MKCFVGETDFRITEPSAVTIGKFDGRHKGHQKLLNELLEWKKRKGYAAAVFTFDMSPMVRVPSIPVQGISTASERRREMEQMGIDYLVEYPFTRRTAQMPPEEFVREILADRMNARAVVVGTDCGFGRNREGNADLLRRLSAELGFELEVIEKEQDGGRDISSSYVKEELDAGNMEKVSSLLGHPYSFEGTVVHGNHMGGPLLGFPTANIAPQEGKALPPFGVYISRVKAEDRYYRGVTNIGCKPTVEGRWPVGIETHILGLDRDLYGKRILVELLHFQRPERKFSSLDLLKRQLARDREAAAAFNAESYPLSL